MPEIEIASQPKVDVWRVEHFTNSDGTKALTQRRLAMRGGTEVSLIDQTVEYWGVGVLQVETPQGLVNHQFAYRIAGATTLGEAWAMSEKAGQSAASVEVAKMRAAMMMRRR